MKISYYLNKGRKKNLYCRLSEGNQRITFSLKHNIEIEHWDENCSYVVYNYQYYYTLLELKRHIKKRYKKLNPKDDPLELKDPLHQTKFNIIREELENMIDSEGLESINKLFWNKKAERNNFENYELFIKAIEKASGHKRDQLKILALDHCMQYSTPEGSTFEIVTNNSHSSFLNHMLKEYSYDEIYTETWEQIWEVVLDDEYDKDKFVAEFYRQWTKFWEYKQDRYGYTSTTERHRLDSMTQLNLIINLCSSENLFDLIVKQNDIDLYSVYIVTMLHIYNPEECFNEYNDLYFNDGFIWDWDIIDISDEYPDSDIFYIRELEGDVDEIQIL